MKTFFQFVLAIFLSFIPGIIGVMFAPTMEHSAWMMTLVQSVLTPAPWVFSVAWTILYTILGIALFLVFINKRAHPGYKTCAYWLFGIQMVLNALWSYVFFGAHAVGWAMIVILGLLGVSIGMACVFWRINRWASVLAWVYVAWLVFATYLNGTILLLN